MAILGKRALTDGRKLSRSLANGTSPVRTKFEAFRRVRGSHKPILQGVFGSLQSKNGVGSCDTLFSPRAQVACKDVQFSFIPEYLERLSAIAGDAYHLDHGASGNGHSLRSPLIMNRLPGVRFAL